MGMLSGECNIYKKKDWNIFNQNKGEVASLHMFCSPKRLKSPLKIVINFYLENSKIFITGRIIPAPNKVDKETRPGKNTQVCRIEKHTSGERERN